MREGGGHQYKANNYKRKEGENVLDCSERIVHAGKMQRQAALVVTHKQAIPCPREQRLQARSRGQRSCNVHGRLALQVRQAWACTVLGKQLELRNMPAVACPRQRGHALLILRVNDIRKQRWRHTRPTAMAAASVTNRTRRCCRRQ